MPRLEDLELKIKQTGSIKADFTKKLAESLERLSAAVKSFPKTADNISNLNSAIKSIDADKAAAVAKVATAVGKLAEKASKVDASAAGNVAAIGAAIEQMIDSIDASRLDSISDALQGFKRAVSSLNGVKGTAQAVTAGATPTGSGTPAATIDTTGQAADAIEETGETAGEASTKVSGFRAALEGLKETGAKVGSALKSIGKHALSAGKSLLGMGWDSLKSKVTGLVGGLGNLWHSFTRIAGYRALRTAIKAITQGFSQGIEHLYEWSRIVGNEFKASMDSIATSAHYLRDSLGAMASPLLDALAPALEILVDKFVSLLNIANQFFAALTGKTTWRKAVRTPTEWAKATDDATDSTKKATEAQKKLNKALMDFDEIHLLTTSTTKGSNPSSPSGSGGGSGIDSTHFEEVPIASWIQDIKDAIDSGDWYGAGKLLADKLNGIIDDWDAEAWGRKLGEKIQHGLEFYLGFMQNFHWDTLGGKFADFLNGMIDEINPDDLGEAIVAKFNAAIDLLSGFTDRFDWEAAGKWLADVLVGAFTGLKWKTLGELIGNLAGGILSFLKAGLDELLNRKGEVMDAIGDFFSGLGWSGLKNVVELSAIVLGFKLLFGAVFGDEGLIASVKTMVGDMFTKAGLGGGLGLLVTVTLVWGVSEIIDNIKEYGFQRGMMKSLGVTEPTLRASLVLGQDNDNGVWNAFKSTFDTFGATFTASGIEIPINPKWDGSFVDEARKAFELIKKFMKQLGFDFGEDDLPTSNTPVVSQSTPGAQFDPTTGEYFVANVIVNDVDGSLEKNAGLAGALVGKAGLGGLKGDYPTKVSAADLGASKGNAVALVGKAGLGGLAKTYSSKVSITNLSSAGTQVDKLMQLGKLKKSYTTELNFKTSVVTAKGGSSSGTTSSLLTKSQLVKVLNAYAMGGFPSDDLTQGSLFVAGEMPGQAEMVGNINGKTGVASGKEITGIGDAVRESGATEAALLREQNQLLRQILAKSGSVTLAPSAAAGRWVSQSQAAYARATGV